MNVSYIKNIFIQNMDNLNKNRKREREIPKCKTCEKLCTDKQMEAILKIKCID